MGEVPLYVGFLDLKRKRRPADLARGVLNLRKRRPTDVLFYFIQ